MNDCDVIVLGAGPYGLAAATYLRSIKGLEVRVFGEPMSFWERNMPSGMLLRSGWRASHISDPVQGLTLDAFERSTGADLGSPIQLNGFVQYGKWYQCIAAPDIDRREIAVINRNQNGLRVITRDGQILHCRRVVVAAGIAPFAWRPPEFAHLPSELASHSADYRSLSVFKDRRVVIVGGGQSALEAAALLSELGAEAKVLVRESCIHWLGWQKRIKRFFPMGKLLYAPTDVGPAAVSQLVARPKWFKKLPRSLQDPIARRCVRPAGADWLRKRLENVSVKLGHFVRSATPEGLELRLTLNDGSELRTDHLLFATGYRIDVSKYPFLSAGILSRIALSDGYPILAKGFESSVSGLHFIGAPAAYSFGPLLRFVAGTGYVGRSLGQFVGEGPSR